MMFLNTKVLAACIMNYIEIYGERTQHMATHMVFAMAAFPGYMFKGDLETIANYKSADFLTPREFFAGLAHPMVASRFPGMTKEKTDDLVDQDDFYTTNIPELEDRRF